MWIQRVQRHCVTGSFEILRIHASMFLIPHQDSDISSQLPCTQNPLLLEVLLLSRVCHAASCTNLIVPSVLSLNVWSGLLNLYAFKTIRQTLPSVIFPFLNVISNLKERNSQKYYMYSVNGKPEKVTRTNHSDGQENLGYR